MNSDHPYGILELSQLQDHPAILELKAMRAAMSAYKREQYPALRHPYDHAEAAARLLWSPEVFSFERKAPYDGLVYRNHFVPPVWTAILDPNETETMVCGPGSSSKTYSVAALAVLIWMSKPAKTTILISSTSGTGADRRTWDAIKELHQAIDDDYRVGRILDHEKIITVDTAYELSGGKKKDRALTSLKNGITIVLLPPGNEGLRAAGALIGIKNELVIWIVDELPMLELSILRYPVANLRSSNPMFKLVGLGNAQAGRNPHRDACEPVNGWRGHNPYNAPHGGTWRTKRGGVCVFLSGFRSPNCHPNLKGVKHVEQYPFPRLTNPLSIRREALSLGGGDWKAGIRSPEALAQLIGEYQEGGDRDLTVLVSSDVPPECLEKPNWGPRPLKNIASLDPSFTDGGDAVVLTLGTMGWEYGSAKPLLHVGRQVELYAEAGQNFKRAIAEQVVAILIDNMISAECFGLDISSDGGTMFQEIARIWKTVEFHAISSLGGCSHESVSADDLRPCDEVYDRLVTEHWMQVKQFVRLGCIRGWDHSAAYALDFYRRKYFQKGKKIALETKKEMKNGRPGSSGTGKSPDHGDSLCYLVAVARRNGMQATRNRLGEEVARPAFRMGQRHSDKVNPFEAIHSTSFLD